MVIEYESYWICNQSHFLIFYIRVLSSQKQTFCYICIALLTIRIGTLSLNADAFKKRLMKQCFINILKNNSKIMVPNLIIQIYLATRPTPLPIREPIDFLLLGR
jgi:hypothetical protein